MATDDTLWSCPKKQQLDALLDPDSEIQEGGEYGRENQGRTFVISVSSHQKGKTNEGLLFGYNVTSIKEEQMSWASSSFTVLLPQNVSKIDRNYYTQVQQKHKMYSHRRLLIPRGSEKGVFSLQYDIEFKYSI